MENKEREVFPQEISAEHKEEKLKNPNTIGELLSIGKDILTSPANVYRSVMGREAIDDLFDSGVVRNAQSAGKVPKSRWGDRVFWSRGAEGKYHGVQKGGYVIEAPYDVAAERAVARDDVTAIYEKAPDDTVRDILEERKSEVTEEKSDDHQIRKQEDAERIAELRRELGLPDKF